MFCTGVVKVAVLLTAVPFQRAKSTVKNKNPIVLYPKINFRWLSPCDGDVADKSTVEQSLTTSTRKINTKKQVICRRRGPDGVLQSAGCVCRSVCLCVHLLVTAVVHVHLCEDLLDHLSKAVSRQYLIAL